MKYSKEAREFIEKKMRKMKGENRSHVQKIAIALSEARDEGYDIPSKKDRFKKLKKLLINK